LYNYPLYLKKYSIKKVQETKEEENKEFSAECIICKKRYASQNQYEQHLNSNKHKEALERDNTKKTFIPTTSLEVGNNSAESSVNDKKDEVEKPVNNENHAVIEPESGSEPIEKTEEQLIEEKIANAKILEITDCLFCRNKAEDLESNINHMAKIHGFFIPDIEYLQNLEGLISYLGEKISIGNVCLYCNETGRAFHSMESVQAHMRDQSHCKLKYEEEIDEYEDFYDFSINPDEDPNNPQKGKELELAERFAKNPAHLDHTGYGLVLPTGKQVGHRSLVTYYRQRYRDPHIANILQHYKKLGWHDDQGSEQIPIHIIKRQQKAEMKLGLKANKLQTHFRHQNPK